MARSRRRVSASEPGGVPRRRLLGILEEDGYEALLSRLTDDETLPTVKLQMEGVTKSDQVPGGSLQYSSSRCRGEVSST